MSKIEIIKDMIYGWSQKVLKKMNQVFNIQDSDNYDLDNLDALK